MRTFPNAEVQILAKEFLGREISTQELRLYPYIDYCCKNPGEFSHKRINSEEKDLLVKYIELGYLNYEVSRISKPFYDFLQAVLFITYIHPLE